VRPARTVPGAGCLGGKSAEPAALVYYFRFHAPGGWVKRRRAGAPAGRRKLRAGRARADRPGRWVCTADELRRERSSPIMPGVDGLYNASRNPRAFKWLKRSSRMLHGVHAGSRRGHG